MKRRTPKFPTFVSLFLFVAVAVLWIATESRHWKDPGLPLGDNVHINAFDGRFVAHNQNYPFFNGTISISSGNTPPPKWPQEKSVRFPGFHFRHFTWPGQWPGGTYWTFAISPVYPLLLTGLSPALWIARTRIHRQMSPSGHCAKCGYDLTANTSGVCPECGNAAAPP